MREIIQFLNDDMKNDPGYEPLSTETRVSLSDGKYTIVFDHHKGVGLHILRHNEPWMDGDIDGSNVFLAAACEIEELQEKVAKYESLLKELTEPGRYQIYARPVRDKVAAEPIQHNPTME